MEFELMKKMRLLKFMWMNLWGLIIDGWIGEIGVGGICEERLCGINKLL